MVAGGEPSGDQSADIVESAESAKIVDNVLIADNVPMAENVENVAEGREGVENAPEVQDDLLAAAVPLESDGFLFAKEAAEVNSEAVTEAVFK